MLIIISGCTKDLITPEVKPEVLPEITTAYLLKQRIISYEPKFREKVIATLPYEVKTFDESYIIHLVARIPDQKSKKEPQYYLWLERSAKNWRDFTTVRSFNMYPLTIHPHYSVIREGRYYKEYTIDLMFEQLVALNERDLTLELINQRNQRSRLTIPSLYIQAYLEMIKESSQ